MNEQTNVNKSIDQLQLRNTQRLRIFCRILLLTEWNSLFVMVITLQKVFGRKNDKRFDISNLDMCSTMTKMLYNGTKTIIEETCLMLKFKYLKIYNNRKQCE